MLLRQIFDPDLAHYSYLVACQESNEAILIDPHRDLDGYLTVAEDEGVEIIAAAETHIHADFLSGVREATERLALRAYLSAEGGSEWQYAWAAAAGEHAPPGKVTLLRDGDTFTIGAVEFRVLATPGHTPEHVSYLVTDRGGGARTPAGLFSGDFVLVGDLGRPDLLELAGGSEGSREQAARALFRSAQRFTALDDHLQVWPAHGAGSSCGKSIGAVPTSTVGYEERYNGALRSATEGEDAFVRTVLADQPTPPTYFGRMKRTNRAGPPLLRRLPRPRRLIDGELEAIVRHGETVVIDTRPDRIRFMRAHLPGALHAPLGRSFSTAVGAMLEEETRPIVLVVEDAGLDRAVRDLVRTGYDRIVAHLDAATLDEYLRSGGETATIPTIDFSDLPSMLGRPEVVVVDVRDHFEYVEGHIPGAVNAPYTRLPEYLARRIPAGRRLVVHCESGARSAVASAALAARGREAVHVDDDWDAWVAQGGAVARGAPAEGS